MGSGRVKKHFFSIVDKLRSRHSLPVLLHLSKLSRSGFYKWKRSVDNCGNSEDIEGHIVAIHSVRPFYGYRRVTVALKREGFVINHKRVYRLMNNLGIQSIIRKKRKYFGKAGSNVFPNLLQRDFASLYPGEKYVTDITYLPVTNGFIYLSAIQDLYNNEIVAYSISARNNLELVFDTLHNLHRSLSVNVVLHSDQGFQYTNSAYKQKLTDMGIHGSHSRKGNCLDNACMESFFSHLKTEALAGKKEQSEQETVTLVDEYIRFYNTERFQKKLGQLSPVEYRGKLAA